MKVFLVSWFYVILAFLTGYISYLYFGWSVFNFAIVLVFFLSFFVYSSALPLGSKRSKVASSTLAVIYTSLCALIKLPLFFTGGLSGLTLLLVSVVIFLFSLSALRFIFFKLESFDIGIGNCRVLPLRKTLILFFCVTLFILFAYIPFYLSDFPGVMVTDSRNELKMIQGLIPMNDNHPLAHTMMIKVLFSLGELIAPASENAGIICYCTVQMLFVSAVFSYAIVTMYKCHIKWWFILLSLCFFAFMPYNSTQSYIVWKDTPFSLCVLALSVTLWNIVYKRRQGQLPDWFDTTIYFLSSFGVCMFRHNGIAAFLPVAAILVFMYFRSSLKLTVASLLVLSLFAFYKGPLLNILHLRSHDTVEALSLPIQQMSQAIIDGVELTEEEYVFLSSCVDIEQIPAEFNPAVSDPIKSLFRQTDPNGEFLSANKVEFFRLYLNLALRCPKSYITAYINQTIGYWYPDMESVVLMTHTLEENALSPLSHELWVKLRSFTFKYYGIPYFGLLFSSGGVLWICIFLVGLAAVRKNWLELLVVLPSLCIVASILVGTAVNNEMRYVYSMFTCLPLFFMAAFGGNHSKSQTRA